MPRPQGDIQYSFERNPLWRLKLHLQSSGWLQYIPPFAIGVLLHMLSKVLTSSYFPTPVNNLGVITSAAAKLLFTAGAFDLITLKFNIRPPEPLPTPPTDKTDICSIILQRRSCRSFQPRKLIPSHRDDVLQYARTCTASKQTLGTSPIRYEYIDSPVKVWPSVNAQEFLVAIVPSMYDRMAYIDVGKSLQKVVLHATKLGLGTCWIGPGADHASVIAALRDRYDLEKDHIACVCAVGYKSVLVPIFIRLIMSRISHSRKPCEELFYADQEFRVPLDMSTGVFAKYSKCYEAARWSPSSFNAQPTLCMGTSLISEKGSVDEKIIRFDFFSSTKSRYYAPIAAGIWLCNWESSCKSVGENGRFVELTAEERGVENEEAVVPIYNISWLQQVVQ